MKKHITVSLLAAAVFTMLAGNGTAQIITATGVLLDKSRMPGDGTEYSFYGNAGQANTYPPFGPGTYGGAPTSSTDPTPLPLEPVHLTNFTQNAGTDFSYVQGEQSTINSTILLPGTSSTSTVTGMLFGNDTPGQKVEPNVVNYTLSNPVENYSNFNVYVMFDNSPADLGGINDTQITLTLTTGSGTVITSKSEPVTAANQGLSAADFAGFNVKGAAAGDILQLGFVANPYGNYGELGGVSFVVPEPSTWALMIGGLGALFFVGRMRRKQNV